MPAAVPCCHRPLPAWPACRPPCVAAACEPPPERPPAPDPLSSPPTRRKLYAPPPIGEPTPLDAKGPPEGRTRVVRIDWFYLTPAGETLNVLA